MENLARTADHLARLVQRRSELETALDERFPSPTKITLELGCGHGHFLSAYAAGHRQDHFVGVDLIRDRVQRAVRKRNRAKLDNLDFFLAEAFEFLAALPSRVALSNVFLLFPDPWPKRRHHKNRLLQSHLLDALSVRSSPETRLYFRTDHVEYFEAAAAAINDHPAWQLAREPWPFELVTVFQARAPSYRSLVASRVPVT